MINTLIGKKLDQTQMFLENGRRVPVTEVEVLDNVVVQVKTIATDKYNAVQLGVGTKKRPTKAVLGHAKKHGSENASKLVREVRVEAEELLNPGEHVVVDQVFKAGDIIDVTGTSKGKGFAGGVKRYGFRGGPKTHGQSDRHRAPGSIGQGTTPGRVYKGKRMAGHMGVDTVTVSNLKVVDVDAENKRLYVLGLVPGYKGAMLTITQKGEDKKFVPLLKVSDGSKAAEGPGAVVEEPVIETAAEVVETPEETVVEEQQEVQVPEEIKEAVESSAVQEPVATDVASEEEKDK